jgi:hypothetical protein
MSALFLYYIPSVDSNQPWNQSYLYWPNQIPRKEPETTHSKSCVDVFKSACSSRLSIVMVVAPIRARTGYMRWQSPTNSFHCSSNSPASWRYSACRRRTNMTWVKIWRVFLKLRLEHYQRLLMEKRKKWPLRNAYTWNIMLNLQVLWKSLNKHVTLNRHKILKANLKLRKPRQMASEKLSNKIRYLFEVGLLISTV